MDPLSQSPISWHDHVPRSAASTKPLHNHRHYPLEQGHSKDRLCCHARPLARNVQGRGYPCATSSSNQPSLSPRQSPETARLHYLRARRLRTSLPPRVPFWQEGCPQGSQGKLACTLPLSLAGSPDYAHRPGCQASDRHHKGSPLQSCKI